MITPRLMSRFYIILYPRGTLELHQESTLTRCKPRDLRSAQARKVYLEVLPQNGTQFGR